jgi:hypothetical protein
MAQSLRRYAAFIPYFPLIARQLMHLKGIYFRVTEKDLQFADLESLRLADGSGDFVAQLGMHHELHCLVCIFHEPFNSRI